MTLQLNFQEKNQEKVLELVNWLRNIGLVDSFDFSNANNELEPSEEVIARLKKGKTEILEGKFYTHEAVKTKIEQWQKIK